MKKLITRNLGGKKVLFLSALTTLVYAAMLLVTIPQVMAFSHGMALLDMMPAGYSPAYVRTLLDTLGEPGRNAYLYRQIPLDLLYPGLFGVSYCLVMAYLLNQLGRLDSRLFYLCLLPVLAGAFDYGENIGIITMLANYPNFSSGAARITAMFSVLKSTSTSLYFIALLLVLIALGKARWLPTAPRH